MTAIGANTPAMIRTMTTEVESKNFIVASMPHYVEGSRADSDRLNFANLAVPCPLPASAST
jgi:hypothetical protein